MQSRFSLLSSSPMAFLLTLTTLVSLLLPSLTLSTGFHVTLKHIDSGRNLTKFNLIQRAITRGKETIEKLSTKNVTIEAPANPGNGEFLVDLSIGNPPQSYSAVVMTASDLIWTQCSPCEHCFQQETSIFDSRNSSSYSALQCSDNLCQELPASFNNNSCEYEYHYGDFWYSQGVLATETFTFDDNVFVENIVFGCGTNNERVDFKGSGIVGLGRGQLSLFTQLKQSEFSYCLTSLDVEFENSLLFIGSDPIDYLNLTSRPKTNTPLVQSPSFGSSSYHISLLGIFIGEKRFSAMLENSNSFLQKEVDSGYGGTIIDSGSMITLLEPSLFYVVAKEFGEQLGLERVNYGLLEACYNLPQDGINVPKFMFNFDGGDLDLPPENYFITNESGDVGCLAVGSNDGQINLIGNVQLQNMFVVYDVGNERISFVPTDQCDLFS